MKIITENLFYKPLTYMNFICFSDDIYLVSGVRVDKKNKLMSLMDNFREKKICY